MPAQTERYTPSETKRFEVSQDPYSRARLRAVIDTARDLQQTDPFFLGVSLWGSLSKGKELTTELLPTTDIELVAFYDAEKFQESGLDENYNMAKRISTEVKKGITSHLAEQGDTPDINLSVRGLAFEGEYSMLARVMDLVTGNYRDEQDLNQLVGAISAFFGFNPSGGLKPYRVQFFEKVASIMPEEKADKLWNIVSENVIKVVERGVHGTTKAHIPQGIEKFYPSTFKDAAHYYGAKLQGK